VPAASALENAGAAPDTGASPEAGDNHAGDHHAGAAPDTGASPEAGASPRRATTTPATLQPAM
jgi:hypothetical protein